MPALSILRPGMFTTVQDLGRWGHQSRGVPVSGALDWFSHRLANGLLGNERDAATLEVTLIGPQLRFERQTMFAVAGAEFVLTLDDTPVEMNRTIEAAPGSTLKFGARRRGARAYLAVGGGIDVPLVLGSRSTHVLTGMGGCDGRALRAADALEVGMTRVFRDRRRESHPDPFSGQRKLRVIAADNQLTEQLTTQRFEVSTRSDRMGYRLNVQGASSTIHRRSTGELISTAIPTGAIQVPPTGEPILLMNDHATTGGYEIAAVVITADLPIAAQLAPGDPVGFEACSIETADQALRRLEAMLDA
jgi:antagonist of KipI